MKSGSCGYYSHAINELRDELHLLMENENVSSDIVQEKSEELDDLILLYYKQIAENHELKEP